MRHTFASLLAGVALVATGAPAIAQDTSTQQTEQQTQTQQPNKGRQVLRGILNAILGPDQTQQNAANNAQAAVAPVAMADVLANARRDGDRARDIYRNPSDTLAFFQVRPGQTVVDYMPAGGWYTRVLVPYLGSNGLYIGLTPDPAAADTKRFGDYFGGLPGKFREAAPQWSLSGAPMAVYASQDIPDELKGNVDRVLIFREMHNLLRSGAMYTELTRIRDMLKPDGMVGIVQHRAKANAPADYTLGGNGYLREADVVALMRAHGFELMAQSNVNANPRDTADHEGGVWQMPPTWGGKKPELEKLGESDRMTLLFRKAR